MLIPRHAAAHTSNLLVALKSKPTSHPTAKKLYAYVYKQTAHFMPQRTKCMLPFKRAPTRSSGEQAILCLQLQAVNHFLLSQAVAATTAATAD
jgi:hypothetical protein